MQVMQRIVNGESDLVEVQINGANHYVGFMPLKTAQYSLALVVPKAEMDAAITENRKNIEAQKLSALQVLSTLLAALFIVAVGISFVIGQVITNPLVRLTKIVEQIAGGDMSARAVVETQDETGRLAASVNTMNDELKNILSSLEERIAERTHELERINEINARRAAQFETVARIARTISATQTLDTLLPQIVETISKQFNFYHVGIFLLDNRHEYAILVAANSEGGQKMLARNHRLLVGEIGIVGYVTSVGQPRVALDVGADATYFNNPDLPNTHSEIALPLRIGADIFGALDVQSTEGNAFSEEDISILSTLADQVSIAIQNARSFQQSREALAQAERVSFQLSGQQWSHFIEQQTITGYHFDGTDTKAVTPEQKQRAHNLSIPLTMRGARIGAIKINASDPNHQWTDDELAMVQAAADRAALALENARLLEESQKRATKERTIGDISAKIGGASDLEDIIQTAIQELGNTLPDMDIAIQFTDAPARQ
jgi:GAF domain-containing protein/HAMP domain-containing protein